MEYQLCQLRERFWLLFGNQLQKRAVVIQRSQIPSFEP